MSKEIRELFKQDFQLENGETMPKGHENRFLNKLEGAIPQKKASNFSWYNIAATVLLFIALGIGAYGYFQSEIIINDNTVVDMKTNTSTKSLGDISPNLKKVEDYYIANINLELSKVKVTQENKELFDGYVNRLEVLNQEYGKLSIELNNLGPNEQTVNALIGNLKLRLNLMYRLKEQLKTLKTIKNKSSVNSI